MPELPEVENVCLSLARRILNRTVQRVELRRPEIVTGSATPKALLVGRTLKQIVRHGKQIALITGNRGDEPCICVHLGMTGSLRHHAPQDSYEATRPNSACEPTISLPAQTGTDPHLHVIWTLDDGSKLTFRDPRRFGGIWTYPALAQLHLNRWDDLGPDALKATALEIHERMQKTGRPLKAALLDQNLLAGLGNIYVDELLFTLNLHPQMPANKLELLIIERLVVEMRELLNRAIRAGGSSLRDYVDGEGQAGSFQLVHQVYGRGGKPCLTCQTMLVSLVVGGRTTVYCPSCQPKPGRRYGKSPKKRQTRNKRTSIRKTLTKKSMNSSSP